MAKAYQYDMNGYFSGEVDDYGGPLPNNATRAVPQVQSGYIPRWTGEAWEQVENHKDKEGYINGKPYTVKEYGPLPEGWSDTPTPPTLKDVRAAKLREIDAGYDAALIATLTMPVGSPGTAEIALATLDFAADDPEGLADVRGILASRRDELRAAVESAASAEEVEAVVVDYPV